MSMPPSYSDRPLWIILIADAALTPVGVYAAAQLLGIDDPLQAIRTGALATGVVVAAGVVVVGVVSMILDAAKTGEKMGDIEKPAAQMPISYTPPSPAVPSRVMLRDRRHPNSVSSAPSHDQYVSHEDSADGDDESPEVVTMIGSTDSPDEVVGEEVFAAEND